MVFEIPFLVQLAVFLFLLFITRDILGEGFDALGAFEPDMYSLTLVGTLASFMYGVSTWDTKNLFANSALALFFVVIGRYLEPKENGITGYRISDRVCRIALPISLCAFVITVIVYLGLRVGLMLALKKGLFVLSVSCPCTVGIIGPAASLIGGLCASKYNVHIKTSRAVENLGKVKEIIFEQDGVVTERVESLYDVYSVDGDKLGVLAVCASIEAHSKHPFASVIMQAAVKNGANIPYADNYFEICGRGVGATVYGDKYFLGNKKLLRDKKIALPDAVQNIALGGYTPLYVVRNGEFCGLLLLGGKKKKAVSGVMQRLKELGVCRILITEDERADIKSDFDILLSEREKVLQELKNNVKMNTMVVSRAPIAKAGVVCTLTPSTKSDITLEDGGLEGILFSLVLGRKSHRVIKQNLLISFVLSALALLSAAGVTQSVMSLATLSILSLILSFAVLLNSLRLLNVKLPDIASSEDDCMFGKVNYTMKIEGMSCAHCSARVKTALESLRGVSANISLDDKAARIKCPASLDVNKLEKAVSDVGFTVVSIERV